VFSGTVETPLVASLGDEKQVYDMLLSKTALKRIAKPEEVSRVILFLLSDQSSYMTASVRLSPEGSASNY
jgi:NAD(P)-dependent dehydrogenase (short-subunit alcohol dehydrogenase family)